MSLSLSLSEVSEKPGAVQCLAACEGDECRDCDELPAELTISGVRYGADLNQVQLELSEAPSLVDCTALGVRDAALREEAESRGLSARVHVGFMVHYAGRNGALRFGDGLELGDQGGAWVLEREGTAEESLISEDDFLGDFDLQETFDCFSG